MSPSVLIFLSQDRGQVYIKVGSINVKEHVIEGNAEIFQVLLY